MRTPRKNPALAPLLTALALTTLATSQAAASEWEPIYREEGIQVWQRPVKGSSLVEFRARTIMRANLKRILAVLHDLDHKTDWMDNCVENRVLRLQGVGKRVVYNRHGSTFPLVADRDVVVQTKLQWWTEERRVRIEAWDIEDPLMPPIDGVVRMPDLHMTWEMRILDRNTTEVMYQVRADPGGAIPQWVVNLVAKNIPKNTLANLRDEVKKTDRYDSSFAMVETFFDWPSVGL